MSKMNMNILQHSQTKKKSCVNKSANHRIYNEQVQIPDLQTNTVTI